METQPACFERRRVHRQGVAADDDVARIFENFVAGLGSLFGWPPGSLFGMPYFCKIARASANVERSGTVGPEPITSRSSPITSERINVSSVAG